MGDRRQAITPSVRTCLPILNHAIAYILVLFRYWDWTDSSTGVEGIPFILRPQQLQLQAPGNQTIQVNSNPLATFPFGNTRPDGFQDLVNNNDADWTPFRPGETGYFREWQQSYRWPTSEVVPQEQYDILDSLVSVHFFASTGASYLRPFAT